MHVHLVMSPMHLGHVMPGVRSRGLTFAVECSHHLAMTDTAREAIEQDNCEQYPGNGRAEGSEDGHDR
nr:hypothetical protein [Pseudomonas sp. PS01302]